MLTGTQGVLSPHPQSLSTPKQGARRPWVSIACQLLDTPVWMSLTCRCRYRSIMNTLLQPG